ncbi:hypothetical protein DFH08DRAFT_898660 [Mycena albidolilacea]|uniref:Heterokaryon incompatibility domain-containing protein n=1 Tax=Mycena albidolilacea TaxID=1033008 RepID=A0AAD7EBN0_9AGAR|nr:hypothetical protein DFH08DRAFT_898660 [Mycena albidolilacea]
MSLSWNTDTSPDPQARQRAISSLPAYLPGFPKEISHQTKAIHTLLFDQTADDKLKSQDRASRVVYNVFFGNILQHDKPLDIMTNAIPERYRLLHCVEAVSNQTLRIIEYSNFPCVQYAALSYVWRGNSPTSSFGLTAREFSVLGAEDADPIGLDVLVDACAAALACGASYLWLDRLCIMQTSKQDKQWQIREMYRMYTFAIVCIVVPSGLRFLVSFAEETQWIHRAWTLQEVVAPPSVAVLFSWTHGDGQVLSRLLGETFYGRIEVVTRGRSAMAGLGNVLASCAGGRFEFTPDSADTAVSPLIIEAALFGKVQSDSDVGESGTDNHIAFPHITALGFAIDRNLDTEEMRDFCIWQCALVRTSSRPVDMIFSIMGILGVILNPKEFLDDDRLGATVALAREILRQGRSANWLAMHITIPPCPQLSTFPTLPRTSVAGRAMYDLPSGSEQTLALADAVYPNDNGLFPALKGSMDDSGYLSLNARAVMVVTAPEALTLSDDSPYDNPVCPTQLRAMDGSKWTIVSDEVGISKNYECSASPLSGEPRSFALILGWYNYMPAGTDGDNIRAMLVTEHTNSLYHVRSYFVLSHKAIKWASTRIEQHFCVGGPE